jgi:predicted Zn-dependent protease
MSRLYRSGIGVVLALGLVTTACAKNPATGKREIAMMTEAQEIELGRQYDAEIRQEMGEYQDEALQRYVDEIGMRLARSSERPHLPWTFTIVDSPAVNAFALPGGYIYLTRGIMPYLSSEAALAAVLGHEIGHVTARHSVRQYTKGALSEIGLLALSIFVPQTRPFSDLGSTGLSLLFLKYSRGDELQADRLGTEYTARGGWDPHGMHDMLETLTRISEGTDRRGVPNWLATHPAPASRVEEIQPVVNTVATSQATWTVHRDEFLQRIDGMLFGDNPQEGIVRGSEFIHPDMRIAMAFPPDWDIVNGQEQVMAKSPAGDALMLLQIVQQPRGTRGTQASLGDVAVAGMQRAGFRMVDGSLDDINGLTAHVGTYRGSMRPLGSVVTRAAHIAQGRRVFVVAGVAQPQAYDKLAAEFTRSIDSFRELDRREAADVRPNVVDLYTVREGDSWQSIAARAGGGNVKATTLAIMNGYAVNQQPRTGDRIKIVVAG